MECAFLASDASYDGLFWTAVRTTGIFCRPTCPARKPKPENCEFFGTVREAMFAGYRACKRCKPLQAPGAAPDWVAPLLSEIDSDPQPRVQAHHLRERGLDPGRVRRWFVAHYGMTFAAYCRAKRLGGALRQLRSGASVDDAVFESGYRSHSGFRDAFGKSFGQAPGKGRSMEPVITAMIESPVGPLLAGARDEGVCLLEFTDRRMLEAQLQTVQRRLGAALVPGEHRWLRKLKTELDEYFAGARRDFTVPLVAPGTPFQEQVWAELRKIPHGETICYEELAKRFGRPGASRAVGTANGMNRIAILIPCHRVLNKSGELGGYGGGMWRKQKLLELEKGEAAIKSIFGSVAIGG
ncbi:MAG: methylated-DNA--[protein]-cysteine S-methyltransferase [Planctomycetes bacterium]|nr:methylated-DNA--[protein]-cysteine S-methyltransferase [Planctomycetota bacterium]